MLPVNRSLAFFTILQIATVVLAVVLYIVIPQSACYMLLAVDLALGPVCLF